MDDSTDPATIAIIDERVAHWAAQVRVRVLG